MNYVPLNSNAFYTNQKKSILQPPKSRFNSPVNNYSHINAQTLEIRPPRTPIPFSTIMPMTHTDTAIPLSNVNQKLATLTFNLEKEFEGEATVGKYYGQCTKCRQSITGSSSDVCQAMGKLYHSDCFKCVLCARILRGKAFYRIHDQVYCEEDYLFTGFQQTIEKCYICDHLIMDQMLQALGHTYHPGCFRCSICNESLDNHPFTIDKDQRLFCLNDYHNTYAPRCAKCTDPICPDDGCDETIRVIAMNKNFHIECYRCKDCQSSLSDEQTTALLGGCCPLPDGTLLCYRCRMRRGVNNK
ncbi:unnamed protein product [Adineta steineri]|uniref:LIM zinc-binding domain-containing protein n=1 Tax=Adineta steineri TaxID=433720 RepID=A0A815KY86_9BILA|nr:unnamed protein product [Adineta steineri]CAF1401743.1 unnamed protein product [Adineta steineri]